MRTILMSFFLVCFSLNSNGQQLGTFGADRFVIKVNSRLNITENPNSDIQGSPYLNAEFRNGDVFSKGGRYPNVKMRLNIYTNQIEFVQNESVYVLDASPQIKKITIDNNVIVIDSIEYKGATKLNYLLRLDSGRATLLMKKVIVFKPKEEPKGIDYTKPTDKYVPLADIYYVKIGNNIPVKIDNQKKMVTLFPMAEQDALNAYISKEKLSLKKEEDLIRLIQYYNSL